jgi:TRAP transporter TAXI family solute receptor
LKKFSFILVIALTFSMVLTACGASDDEVTILTGGSGGTYFPLGAALATIINDNVDDVTATSIEANASVANINEIAETEDLMMGLVQNDIAYYASQGLSMFEEGSITSFSGVATLYPEVIQVVTSADSGISTIEDLVGKRVAVGDVGSGAEANAKQILESHGITYDDLNAEFLDFTSAADGIQDGNIDAAFITAGLPTAAIESLKVNRDIQLVSITTDNIANIISQYPYYTSVTIEDAYGTGQDVTTVAVQAMLIVSNNAGDDLIYNITKAMFENTDKFVSAHAGQGPAITLKSALDGMPIKVHPGAQKYYDEVK